METTFELSESVAEVLKVEDMLQSKDESMQGLSWRMLQSSLHQSKKFDDDFAQVQSSLSELKQKLTDNRPPDDLTQILSALPTPQPIDAAEFLRNKLQHNQTPSHSEQPLASQLRESHLHVTELKKAVHLCENQIVAMKQAIFDTHAIMKELNHKWASEKEQSEALREQLKTLTSIQNSGASGEKSEIETLKAKNRKLAEQVQRNVEVFQELAQTMNKNEELERAIEDQNKEIQRLKTEKAQVVGVVQKLVETTQGILTSSQRTKREKFQGVIELMGSLASINFHEDQ